MPSDLLDFNPAEPVNRADMTRISSYVEAMEIFRSPDFYSPLHYRYSHPVVGTSILSLFGPAHTQRRRTDLPVVSRNALMRYEFDTTMPVIREKLALPSGADEHRVDLLAVMTPAVMKVAAAVIGLDGVVSDDDVAELAAIGTRISNGVTAEWLLLPVEEAVRDALSAREDFIVRFYGASRQRRADLVAAWRRGEVPDADLPDDIVTLFLRSPDEPDDEALVRECLFWLTASTDTTIHSSAHAFMEIRTWLDAHPEDREMFDDLAFLQRAVGEAIRLHPPLPSALRRALADVTLPTGRHIVRGEYLDLDLNAIDRDQSFFGDDASEFNPHREDESALKVFGVSFGHGVHSCLGRRLAVGAGNGRIESESAPVGLVVRLVQALLLCGAAIDEDDPPELRARSTNGRWDRFPLTIRRARVAA
jgi:cytochrome P450